MAVSRDRSEWNRAAAIIAMIANSARDPGKRPRPYKPQEFNPYDRPQKSKGKGSIEDFKVFFDGSR